MAHAIFLWSIWQALLSAFAWAFTRPGFRRFAEWITALAINPEEHTITQSVVALERIDDWKALETFAESGHWRADRLTRTLTRLVETAPGRTWHGYHVQAIDDTKVDRNRKQVWGTCTFPEYTARCPHRASTVRAHNWVVCGALLQNPGRPAWFLPLSGRLYFRKTQWPLSGAGRGRRVPFRTKCDLTVDLAREQAQIVGGRHLAIFEGGLALNSVVEPLVEPQDDSPRIEFLTRRRHDARLYAPLPEHPRPNPKWGPRLSPPRQGGWWERRWHTGEIFLYGRRRKVRWKAVTGRWWVSGPDVPVTAVVAEVEGYKKRFTIVTAATELTGLQMVELVCARFRQEDGFRDLKQRLGWEECRAWTRNPIERTSQAQWITMSLLRLAPFRLEAAGEVDWWFCPPWNRKKDRPSVWDVERLFRRHQAALPSFLSDWLGNEGDVA